ncbi:apolipoprotein D isoform X3 [Pezoporus flaviventris]|uniref:apolipoprotein D isoform X3 n=1 Tax=Pezoporus flaviventris TaxID=889875 RepID=UPI002AAF3E01|nr:apolipoprotein D isoform X3 [Pezoporus flaviventris]
MSAKQVQSGSVGDCLIFVQKSVWTSQCNSRAEEKAVLITGCDKGFGRALAKQLHAKGFTVFAGYLHVKNKDPSGFSLQGLRPWQQCQAVQGTFLRAQESHCLSCHNRVHFPPASWCSHAGHSSEALGPVQPPWLWEMPDVSYGTMPRPSSPRRLRYQPAPMAKSTRLKEKSCTWT